MKPTAPWRGNFNEIATDPARGLSLSRQAYGDRRVKARSYTSVALVLLAAAGTISIPICRINGVNEYSRHMKVVADIEGINTQLKLYERLNGFYPPTAQGLQALVTQPDTDPRPRHWHQLWREKPKDPWQRITFIGAPASNILKAAISILQGPTTSPIRRTMIGADSHDA